MVEVTAPDRQVLTLYLTVFLNSDESRSANERKSVNVKEIAKNL
jgi:hypothetical protein